MLDKLGYDIQLIYVKKKSGGDDPFSMGSADEAAGTDIDGCF